MKTPKFCTTMVITALIGLIVGVGPVAAGGMDLIKNLASSAGVTEDQALGGTQALLGVAKGNLGDEAFGQLLSGTPDLGDIVGDGLGAASGAATDAASAMSGGDAMSSMKEMAGEAAGAAGGGGLAALASNADLIQQFSDLGMDAGMIQTLAGGLLDAVGGGGVGSGLMSPKTELLRKGLGLL